MGFSQFPLIPAKAGTQAFFGVFESRPDPEEKIGVPAFAGMSGREDTFDLNPPSLWESRHG